jgi:hypothetical protein
VQPVAQTFYVAGVWLGIAQQRKAHDLVVQCPQGIAGNVSAVEPPHHHDAIDYG